MMNKPTSSKDRIIVIKKYPNRRLYDTSMSDYITLNDIYDMIKSKINFVVNDAKTGEDITRSVLTQLIVEQENKGKNVLPTNLLKQFIMFQDHNMQNIFFDFLENSMIYFLHNQDKLTEFYNHNLKRNLHDVNLLEIMEEGTKLNLSMWKDFMELFYNNLNKK